MKGARCGCGRALAWNGGEVVGGVERCERCARAFRARVRAERQALERCGQTTLQELVPLPLREEVGLGGLFSQRELDREACAETPRFCPECGAKWERIADLGTWVAYRCVNGHNCAF